MFFILIDTCVWLDLVKDQRQEQLLTALESLTKNMTITLVVPRIVLDEFARNKVRVAEECRKSQASTLKAAKNILAEISSGKGKLPAIEHLAEIYRKLPNMAESSTRVVGRIEKLFRSSMIVETTESVKLRAAERAIDKRAPFHRQHNSISDAMIIEIYSDLVNGKLIGSSKPALARTPLRGARYIFITYNTKDFSYPSSDTHMPHPDMTDSFSKVRSLYMISLAETLRKIAPKLVADIKFEIEYEEEPRPISEIDDEIGELLDKVWYNRHQVLLDKIKDGTIKVVQKETFPVVDHEHRPVQRDILEGAIASAARIEKKYGVENLGPWDDFEWGMMNGKLSALRWVLGDDWDSLYT